MTDQYGNHVDDYDFTGISVTFKIGYGSQEIDLKKVPMPGKLHYYADDASNAIF